MGFKRGQSGNPKGRPKGSPNKATAKREAEIEASGLTPLEYMLKMLRDEDASTEERMWAAKAAAPYVHPKLASVEHRGSEEEPVQHSFTMILAPKK